MKKNFLKLFPSTKKPVIGMIHLLAMPGSEGYPGYTKILEHALGELESLQAGGIDGVLVENDNDSPYTLTASQATVAIMTGITAQVVKHSKVPVGVEVLLNDPKASLSIAMAGGAQFIRTDYFVDRMSRPEYGGEISINAAEVIQFRKALLAEEICILADVQVKHAQLLDKNKKIAVSVQQAEAAGADGVIVSGDLTGLQPVTDHLSEAAQAAKDIPVLIGSGFASTNALALLQHSDGAIVGTSIKDGKKVSSIKTAQLMNTVKKHP